VKHVAIWCAIGFVFIGAVLAHGRINNLELRADFTEYDIKKIQEVLDYNRLHGKPLDYTFGDIKTLDGAYVNGDQLTGDIEVRRKGWKITIKKDGTVTREKEGGE